MSHKCASTFGKTFPLSSCLVKRLFLFANTLQVRLSSGRSVRERAILRVSGIFSQWRRDVRMWVNCDEAHEVFETNPFWDQPFLCPSVISLTLLGWQDSKKMWLCNILMSIKNRWHEIRSRRRNWQSLCNNSKYQPKLYYNRLSFLMFNLCPHLWCKQC